ncbi:PREDICTED: selenocysteine insertion sequence-binding protein 2-like [Priapulus caudatus]|uniref:Selenocysteine insertion sequence-binding protein 2-like n=1 Tax=Priapulus caudatus TaxID=37621 RepID=A0ABM1E2M6_PRICU|nr:PREDICTED: selenocysteine insertion sequence-binding protein 2-like [Priapulus caudatus]
MSKLSAESQPFIPRHVGDAPQPEETADTVLGEELQPSRAPSGKAQVQMPDEKQENVTVVPAQVEHVVEEQNGTAEDQPENETYQQDDTTEIYTQQQQQQQQQRQHEQLQGVDYGPHQQGSETTVSVYNQPGEFKSLPKYMTSCYPFVQGDPGYVKNRWPMNQSQQILPSNLSPGLPQIAAPAGSAAYGPLNKSPIYDSFVYGYNPAVYPAPPVADPQPIGYYAGNVTYASGVPMYQPFTVSQPQQVIDTTIPVVSNQVQRVTGAISKKNAQTNLPNRKKGSAKHRTVICVELSTQTDFSEKIAEHSLDELPSRLYRVRANQARHKVRSDTISMDTTCDDSRISGSRHKRTASKASSSRPKDFVQSPSVAASASVLPVESQEKPEPTSSVPSPMNYAQALRNNWTRLSASVEQKAAEKASKDAADGRREESPEDGAGPDRKEAVSKGSEAENNPSSKCNVEASHGVVTITQPTSEVESKPTAVVNGEVANAIEVEAPSTGGGRGDVTVMSVQPAPSPPVVPWTGISYSSALKSKLKSASSPAGVLPHPPIMIGKAGGAPSPLAMPAEVQINKTEEKQAKKKSKKKKKEQLVPQPAVPSKPAKKSQAPIQFDIGNMIAALEKQKIASAQVNEEKQEDRHAEKKTEKPKLVANPLDSTAPAKRGKEKENPARKRPSALKKVILKERQEKKRVRLMKEEMHGQLSAGTAAANRVLKPMDAVGEADVLFTAPEMSQEVVPKTQDTEDLSPISQATPLHMTPLSQVPTAGTGDSAIPGMNSAERNLVTMQIHSRRFREYCTQMLHKDIDNCCTLLLQDLVRFQDRLYHKDKIKARARRRIVLGLREVAKHLKLRKLKLLIISPNLERIQSKGGLDDALHNIIRLAQDQNVPFVFALGRRALGRACAKLVPVSVVGVFNYEGSEEHFQQLMDLSAQARKSYQEMVAAVEREANEIAKKQLYMHMGHSRTPSACSAISFTSSILSEPISENYPMSEPESSDAAARGAHFLQQRELLAALGNTLNVAPLDGGGGGVLQRELRRAVRSSRRRRRRERTVSRRTTTPREDGQSGRRCGNAIPRARRRRSRTPKFQTRPPPRRRPREVTAGPIVTPTRQGAATTDVRRSSPMLTARFEQSTVTQPAAAEAEAAPRRRVDDRARGSVAPTDERDATKPAQSQAAASEPAASRRLEAVVSSEVIDGETLSSSSAKRSKIMDKRRIESWIAETQSRLETRDICNDVGEASAASEVGGAGGGAAVVTATVGGDGASSTSCTKDIRVRKNISSKEFHSKGECPQVAACVGAANIRPSSNISPSMQ